MLKNFSLNLTLLVTIFSCSTFDESFCPREDNPCGQQRRGDDQPDRLKNPSGKNPYDQNARSAPGAFSIIVPPADASQLDAIPAPGSCRLLRASDVEATPPARTAVDRYADDKTGDGRTQAFGHHIDRRDGREREGYGHSQDRPASRRTSAQLHRRAALLDLARSKGVEVPQSQTNHTTPTQNTKIFDRYLPDTEAELEFKIKTYFTPLGRMAPKCCWFEKFGFCCRDKCPYLHLNKDASPKWLPCCKIKSCEQHWPKRPPFVCTFFSLNKSVCPYSQGKALGCAGLHCGGKQGLQGLLEKRVPGWELIRIILKVTGHLPKDPQGPEVIDVTPCVDDDLD